MSGLVILTVGIVGSVVAYSAAQAASARLLGIHVLAINIFWGRTILRVRLAGTHLCVGWLPLGGSVQLEAESGVAGSFSSAHPLIRVAIYAMGPTTLVVLGALLLGPANAVTSYLNGFAEIVGGALHPCTIGTPLMAAARDGLSDSPRLRALAEVVVRFAALNSLPVLPMTGGQILTTLLRWRSTAFRRWEVVATLVGQLICVAGLVSWVVVLVLTLRRAFE
jgi:membrane-associated protease RseP (regulator of RpoE activity)